MILILILNEEAINLFPKKQGVLPLRLSAQSSGLKLYSAHTKSNKSQKLKAKKIRL